MINQYIPALTPDQIRKAQIREILRNRGFYLFEIRESNEVYHSLKYTVCLYNDGLVTSHNRSRSVTFDRVNKRSRDR